MDSLGHQRINGVHQLVKMMRKLPDLSASADCKPGVRFSSADLFHRFCQQPQLFENEGVHDIGNQRNQKNESDIGADQQIAGLGDMLHHILHRDHIDQRSADPLKRSMNKKEGASVFLVVHIPLTCFPVALQPLCYRILHQLIAVCKRMILARKQTHPGIGYEHLGLIVPYFCIGFGREAVQHHINLNHPHVMTGRNAYSPQQ
ncbi:hypothetical protein D3C75_252580 [compost metagenome]